MLSPAQRDCLHVVLVSPRNPLNIGAAARAMANFGFTQLSVVAPYAPTWREARSAVGAPELLQIAREYATLPEAVAGCTLVVGTGTLTHRKPEQPVMALPALAPQVSREMARGGSVGLVFGPEKRGLTRDDLSYCHLLAEIPTSPLQPSMNLGQAVAVCLYELATRAFEGGPEPVPGRSGSGEAQGSAEDAQPASSAALELLGDVVDQVMTASAYSPTEMQAANRHDMRLLLRRLAFTESDARRALRLFRRILWRLKR